MTILSAFLLYYLTKPLTITHSMAHFIGVYIFMSSLDGALLLFLHSCGMGMIFAFLISYLAPPLPMVQSLARFMSELISQ